MTTAPRRHIFECFHCDYTCHWLQELIDHHREKHAERITVTRRDYRLRGGGKKVCPLCPMRFYTMKSVRRHIQRNHREKE